jgi:hypothetical protein
MVIIGIASAAASCATDDPIDDAADLTEPPAEATQQVIELEAAKIVIEHNATDVETGFRGFVNGEPWRRMDVTRPDGRLVVRLAAANQLRELGLTAVSFETQRPSTAGTPIEDLMRRMPEGEYGFVGTTVKGAFTMGMATLSHAIPDGVRITTPVPGAHVSADQSLTIAWMPVTRALDGRPVTVSHYQLTVAALHLGPHPGFGAERYSASVPSTIKSMTVPHEFLLPDRYYRYEVLAIADNGNQTFVVGEFNTRVLR